MKGKGILLSATNGLIVQNKTLLIGDTTNQEIQLLALLNKGQHRMQPKVGAELRKLLKARAREVRVKRDINEQLLNDGFKKIKVKMNFPNIDIDATR